jgi:hypothetical protein
MKDQETPMTPAVRMLRAGAVPFKPHFYAYVEQDVAIHAAAALGVPEHEVVKTLLMEHVDGSGKKSRLLVLMHADREASMPVPKRVPGGRDETESAGYSGRGKLKQAGATQGRRGPVIPSGRGSSTVLLSARSCPYPRSAAGRPGCWIAR